VPEGDTIFRVAAALRGYLAGQRIEAARARVPGPRIERVVGSRVNEVESRGKHLLVHFDNGLVLHSHLRMQGTWHRYRPGERWRRPAAQARVVLEVPGSVVVCFDAPVMELLEERAIELHPALRTLGPDLLADEFDAEDALRRLRAPARQGLSLAEALLDQRAQAGVGNVFKSEVLFLEHQHPMRRVRDVDDDTLRRLLATAEEQLRANTTTRGRVTTGRRPAPSRTWVYGRAGRPCLRCGARIERARIGDLPRPTFWCPRCQPAPEPAS
jgi:endonuclease-8